MSFGLVETRRDAVPSGLRKENPDTGTTTLRRGVTDRDGATSGRGQNVYGIEETRKPMGARGECPSRQSGHDRRGAGCEGRRSPEIQQGSRSEPKGSEKVVTRFSRDTFAQWRLLAKTRTLLVGEGEGETVHYVRVEVRRGQKEKVTVAQRKSRSRHWSFERKKKRQTRKAETGTMEINAEGRTS